MCNDVILSAQVYIPNKSAFPGTHGFFSIVAILGLLNHFILIASSSALCLGGFVG